VKILAIEHELSNSSADQFKEYARAEALKVWELQQSSVIREIYFRADRDEAVLVLECESISEAQEILGTLPFVGSNLISFEIIPLKAYPGLARLFDSEKSQNDNRQY